MIRDFNNKAGRAITSHMVFRDVRSQCCANQSTNVSRFTQVGALDQIQKCLSPEACEAAPQCEPMNKSFSHCCDSQIKRQYRHNLLLWLIGSSITFVCCSIIFVWYLYGGPAVRQHPSDLFFWKN